MSSRNHEDNFDYDGEDYSDELFADFETDFEVDFAPVSEWRPEASYEPGPQDVRDAVWYDQEALPAHPVGSASECFVPEKYESNYAYPLIVWLHSAADGRPTLSSVMQGVSPQNYMGLSFHPANQSEVPSRSLTEWPRSDAAVRQFLEEVHATVCQLGSYYHLHSERIFLAGFEDAGEMALRAFLNKPEWFGGAIALGSPFPETLRYPDHLPMMEDKRVLVGQGLKDPVATIADNVCWTRTFKSAGAEITPKMFDGKHSLTPEMLKYLNLWLMEGMTADNIIF